MQDLTTTREYQAGMRAWQRQNFIAPGYTYTWQTQAYDLGFNTARNADNQRPETFTTLGEAAAKALKNLSEDF